MGNRAVIQFGRDENALGIYLHWNGGVESVKAFLDFAKEAGVGRYDDDYAIARVAQIIGNFFGGTSSVGVGLASRLDRDNCDNGTYIVEGLTIVDRLYMPEYRVGDTWDPEYYEGVFGSCYDQSGAFFALAERPASDPIPPMIGEEMILESAE